MRGNFNIVILVVYLVFGVVLMGVAMVLAVKFLLKAIYEWILLCLPKESVDLRVKSNDEALLLITLVVLVVYGVITHFLGT